MGRHSSWPFACVLAILPLLGARASPFRLVGGELVAPAELEQHSLRNVAKFPAFNLSDPFVGKFSELVDDSLARWRSLGGPSTEPGTGRGRISRAILDSMGQRADFMSYCAHVRVVKGRIFFRLGGFLVENAAVIRFAYSMRALERAISAYKLSSISAEFFFNAMDFPLSRDDHRAGTMGGYPVFSVASWPGVVDILVPDGVEMEPGYLPDNPEEVPWEARKPQAVFRGYNRGFEFHEDTNWRASPRVLLQQMSAIQPHLLDAKVVTWANVRSNRTRAKMANDGLYDGGGFLRRDLEQYKYEIVVDGRSGSSRTCGVLLSSRVLIKQESSFAPFFWPLLKPYAHYMPTKRAFQDLYRQIHLLHANDLEAHAMVHRAQKLAQRVCTWEGKELFWAVLVVKYSLEAMEDSASVEAPRQVGSYVLPAGLAQLHAQDDNLDPEKLFPPLYVPECGHSKSSVGILHKSNWTWLTIDALKEFKKDPTY